MDTIISLLFAAATASATQIGIVPGAVSYSYRSDAGTPDAFLHLGQARGPAPLAQIFNHEPVGPTPLPYLVHQPIVIAPQLPLHHSHHRENGQGSESAHQYNNEHGASGIKGYNIQNQHAAGEAADYGQKHRESYYGSDEGQNKKVYDQADAHGKHHKSGSSYAGGDKGHKKHFSHGEDVTGYHKVFHKDELKKDHDFYDVADNSGKFHRHDYQKGDRSAENGGHKKGGHHNSGYDEKHSDSEESLEDSDVDEEHKEHFYKEGVHKHHDIGEDYGNKGGQERESEYLYEDDEDDEDDDEDDDTE